jgi:hypothetical protein
VPVREQKVQGYHAERVYENVLRFRNAWGRYHRPDDVNRLLRLFPHVSIQQGYILDYLSMGGTTSGWIWPYARRGDAGSEPGPPPALAAIERDRLVGQRGSGELRRLEAETLYRFFQYEPSGTGLFEYAFFVNELWSTKSASKAAEWLDLQPVFTKRRFDSVLREVKQVLRVVRPESCDPVARFGAEGGGEVEFMVYHGGPWRRIFNLKIQVDADGCVRRAPGSLVANLG